MSRKPKAEPKPNDHLPRNENAKRERPLWLRAGPEGGLQPLSKVFGTDRGTCIDRYYIEGFLEKNRGDIKGRVLEVGDPRYTIKFGGDAVRTCEVLHVIPAYPQATLIADLVTGEGIPAEAFDCMIVTQTLHVIYDIRSAVANVYAALKPMGVVLATLPCVSQISRWDMSRWGDYWRLTSLAARKLFEEVFPAGSVHTVAYGNVLAAAAFLYGVTAEELTKEELDYFDPDYEVLIAVRAVKPADPAS